jgi:hypothetical protein
MRARVPRTGLRVTAASKHRSLPVALPRTPAAKGTTIPIKG